MDRKPSTKAIDLLYFFIYQSTKRKYNRINLADLIVRVVSQSMEIRQ